MWKNAMESAKKHILLTSFQHFCAGFGLAILIQTYSQGTAFLPEAYGWLLVGFSAAIHIYEFAAAQRSLK